MSIIAVYRDVPKPPVDFTEFDFASLQIDPLITFTRASAGTYFDADGVMQTAAINEPRIDHDPVTGEVRGLLVEERRTNSLLNSAALATQSVTVTAAARTLSFYGTGTVTLSGASTAGPLVGTGANERVSLTFTPAAGTLTLTVSGTVEKAQLEVGAFPTSHIPTEGAAVTRAVDVAVVNSLSSIRYNTAEGSLFAEFRPGFQEGTVYPAVASIGNSGTTDFANLIHTPSGGNRLRASLSSSGVLRELTGFSPYVPGESYRSALAFGEGLFSASAHGQAPVSTSQAAPMAASRLVLGSFAGANYLSSTIRRIRYYPRRLSNTELQEITA